jgi:hypothetical protein
MFLFYLVVMLNQQGQQKLVNILLSNLVLYHRQGTLRDMDSGVTDLDIFLLRGL